MISTDDLRAWRDEEARKAIAEGAPAFLGNPDAWYQRPHWFCHRGHVSARYLRTESDRGALCLACLDPVVLGPAIGEREFAQILAGMSNRS